MEKIKSNLDNQSVEFWRKWALTLFIPIASIMLGYLSLNLETNLLKKMDEKYVSKETFKIFEDKVNKNSAKIDEANLGFVPLRRYEMEVPPLTTKQLAQHGALVTLEVNLKNLTDLVVEVRADIREMNKTLKNSQK